MAFFLGGGVVAFSAFLTQRAILFCFKKSAILLIAINLFCFCALAMALIDSEQSISNGNNA